MVPDPQLIQDLSEVGLSNVEAVAMSPSHFDPCAQLGIAIASRYPLTDAAVSRLTNPGIRAVVRGRRWVLHDKGMLSSSVKLGPSLLQLYRVYLFPFHEFGVKDEDALVSNMWAEFWGHLDDQAVSERLIVAGDFNQPGIASAASRWSRVRWRFCVDDAVTTRFGMAIDEIAYNWSADQVETRIITTFSDHNLVVAQLDRIVAETFAT